MALKVLSALDTAKTQWYHFKAIIIAGMGFFTDAYDLFCIPPLMKLIGRIYYDNNTPDEDESKYEIPASVSSIMLGIALLGTVIGQILFGLLGDRMGRQRVYGLALVLMVLASLGCGFSICTTRKCALTSLGFFGFMLGIGIGGGYPLSAIIMSEFANKKTRGFFIAAVFVTMVVTQIFKATSKASIDLAWRIILMIGAIFNATSKASIHETPKTADLACRIFLMIGAIPAAMTLFGG